MLLAWSSKRVFITWCGVVRTTYSFSSQFLKVLIYLHREVRLQLLGRMITSDAVFTRDVKISVVIGKSGIHQGISFHQHIGLKFKEETSEMLHLEHSCVWCWNSDTWKVDQKYLESIEMWCWRRMENISWTDRVRTEQVLRRIKEERNTLHAKYDKNKEG